MKFLITGVAGFIGSHLAEALVSLGHNVVGVDCFTDYYPRYIKEQNLVELKKKDRFKFIELDVAEGELVSLLEDIDGIFHLSAQAGVRRSWGTEFNHYLHHNLLATQRILEAMKGKKGLKMVFASSSSVYGVQDKFPTREDAPKKPHSPYGMTKLACENLCELYRLNYGVEFVSLRYFTVFGARQRPDMAFHKFLRKTLLEEKLPVYGDGNQTRDFTYVKDIISGTISAMEKGIPGKAYNLGGGLKVKLMDAIQLIFQLVGKSTQIEYLPNEKGDVRDTMADTTLAQKELGFIPQGSLERGLKEELEWIKKILELENEKNSKAPRV